MKDELRAMMDDFYAKGMKLSREIGGNEERDSKFCASQVSQAMAVLNMRCGEQWGIKLREIPLVVEVIPEPEPAPKPTKKVE